MGVSGERHVLVVRNGRVFSTDPYYFKTWGFPVPAGRLALWHCEQAGAREIPRKSTWKEAARTGAGSSAKNHGKLMVELLKD